MNKNNMGLIFVLTLVAFVVGCVIVISENLLSHLMALGLCVLLGFLSVNLITLSASCEEERAFVKKGFWIALSIRLFLALFFYLYLLQASPKGYVGFLHDDAPGYDYTGWAVANDWKHGSQVRVESRYNAFFYFNAAIYYIFGHHPLIVRFFNALAGALVPPVLYFTAQRVYKEKKVAKLALWLSIFAPDLVHYSIIHLRDVQIALFILLTIYMILCLERLSLPLLGILILAFVYLYLLRWAMAIMVLLLILVYYALSLSTGGFKKVVSLALAGIILVSGARLLLRQTEVEFLDIVATAEQIQVRYFEHPYYEERFRAATVEASEEKFTRGVYLAGSSSSPSNILIALAWNLFSPNPMLLFSSYTLTNLIQFPEGLFWYWLTPFWLGGLILTLKERRVPGFLVYAPALIIFTYGIIKVAGEPLRARLPIFSLLLLLAAYGLHQYRTQYRALYAVNLFKLSYYFIALNIMVFYGITKVSPWGALSTMNLLVTVILLGSAWSFVFLWPHLKFRGR